MDNIDEKQILLKYIEINVNDGFLLFDCIKDKFDNNFIKKIIITLTINRHKNIYELYEYILKYSDLNYDSLLDDIGNIIIDYVVMAHNVYFLNHIVNKVDVNKTNYSGETPLINIGDPSFVSYIICENIDMDMNDINEYRMDLEDENIDYCDYKNKDAISILVYHSTSNYINNESRKKITKILLDNGADINYECPDKGTLLTYICRIYDESHVNYIDFLLENGADPNKVKRDKQNQFNYRKLYIMQTPLMNIINYKHYLVSNNTLLKILGILLKHGADPNVKTINGLNILHLWISTKLDNKCLYDGVELLIKYNIDVNKKDKTGNTPLIYLSKKNMDEDIKNTIKLLLENKANPYIANNKNETIFTICKNTEYIKELFNFYCQR